MPAAHRAVDHHLIRIRDLPYLAAYGTGAILSLLGAWGASVIWGIPFLRCVSVTALCYGAILVGRWVKGMILGILTATEHEGRVEAEETIHRETTVDMEWKTEPRMLPVHKPEPPAWPDGDDPDTMISDRGADQRDYLAEPRNPDLRRAAF